MPLKNILRIRRHAERHIKKEMKEFEKRVSKTRKIELGTELFISFIFMIVSGWFITEKYGMVKTIEVTAFWMFPASIMVFLTLFALLVIEYLRRIR